MTMWSHEYCITNHLIESFSAAFHTKRHRKHSGKLMMLCAELTNPDLSLEIDFEGSTITGQRWFLTLSPMLRCLASQINSEFLGHLHPTSSSWPFEMWGMDVIGPITPPTSKGHRFILDVINYFWKWAKSILLIEVKMSNVIKFIKYHVIYHFGVPRWIIHDNRPQFVRQAF